MDRGAVRAAPILADDVADAGNDRFAVRLREEIDLDFDALSNLIGLFGHQQDTGDAEIQHLPRMPRRLCNGTHARRPFDAMPAGAPLLRMYHHK